MEIPKFGMPQNPDPYVMPQGNKDKKLLFMMFGGVILLALLLVFVLTRSSDNPSQGPLRRSIESTGNSVGILDEYLDDVSHSATKNDLALIQIILRGNQQNLSDLYEKTFPKGKKLASKSRPSEESTKKLDAAKRENVLDSEIIKLLVVDIGNAERHLISAKAGFTGKNSRATIETAQDDLDQVAEILNRSR